MDNIRRTLITGAAAAAAGLAVGYREQEFLHGLARRLRGKPVDEAAVQRRFPRDAARIRELQAHQTVDTVRQLKAKYEGQVFGKVRVWDMVEKLAQCIDPSDDTLMLTSQFTHVQQILAGMERDKVNNPDMIVVALLHDLGKVLLLTPELPEHIVGFTAPIGSYSPGVGLDNVILQFGHDELMYTRLKDHVPEQIAWAIRYHSALPDSIQPYLNAKERAFEQDLLAPFRVYDQGTKSHAGLPRVDMTKYREIIETMFPQPILV